MHVCAHMACSDPAVILCIASMWNHPFRHPTDRESLLVSAMSNHSAICRHQLRLSRLRELVCRARLREVIYVALFLLAFIIPAPSATSCPFPCDPATQCVPLDSSSCQYGVVKDVCECCDVCGHGPEDLCGPYGKCGTGLICVQGYEEGLSEDDLRDYPSFCEPAPTPTARKLN